MRTIPAFLAAAAATMCLATVPVSAQADDGSSVEVAILDIMLERGLIDQAEYEELLSLARAKVESQRNELDVLEGRLERLRAPDLQSSGGAPGKLTFTSPDGKWSMNVKGRLQVRAAKFDNEDNDEDGINFSVPRARLGVSGIAGAENVEYKLELDASTSKSLGDWDESDGTSTKLKDAYIDYGMSETTALQMGHFKFPFGREELISSGNISLMERSAATEVFAPGRDPGFMYHGTAGGGELEYYLAVANGDGENEPNSAAGSGPVAGEEYDGLRYGGRIVFNPMGPMKLDGPAFQTLENDGVKMSVGLAYMTNKDDNGLDPVKADADTLGLEFQMMTGPISLLAEVFDRTADPSAAAPDVDDNGFTVQAGMFLVPSEWELVARLSQVDFDSDGPNGDLEEVTVGVNRYIVGHAGKWMVDLNQLNEDDAGDEKQLRLQYQAIF